MLYLNKNVKQKSEKKIINIKIRIVVTSEGREEKRRWDREGAPWQLQWDWNNSLYVRWWVYVFILLSCFRTRISTNCFV